jgi:hypothetical protein
MTPEDVAGAVKLMYWDLNKAAFDTARGGYRKAQHAGMRFQNWRHKGAGENGRESASTTPATTTSGKPDKPGKQWSSVDETTRMTQTMTYYHHTRKEK